MALVQPTIKSPKELFALSSFIQKIADIDVSDIANLAAMASRRTFSEKELFLRENEICKQLIFIQKGIFRYFLHHQGNDMTKDFAVDVQNPFCTSFTSFMTQEPSQIAIEALEDSDVWVWSAKDILSLFEANLGWALFAKRMTERLYFRKERRELSFLKNSPLENYQKFLIDFPQLNQRIPQYLIASYLGITPESLSRIRRRMSRKT